MKWFKYVSRAFQVVALLGITIPKIMADGIIEAREIFDFFIDTAKICNWDVKLDIPEDVLNTKITGRVS